MDVIRQKKHNEIETHNGSIAKNYCMVSIGGGYQGLGGLSPPPNILGQNFDCLLCFDSHNAISPELKIRLFMYYSWP